MTWLDFYDFSLLIDLYFALIFSIVEIGTHFFVTNGDSITTL